MEKQRKVVLMGNGIITPSVAAHLKKAAVQQAQREARQNTSQERKVVLMGNCIITPTVAAHLRKAAAK